MACICYESKLSAGKGDELEMVEGHTLNEKEFVRFVQSPINKMKGS
ncbi:hypothetical protein [Halalkalibacter sp. APA_J-10(15)]|nr:hypothetical protein [Halalkalibacter sp. APA_J-10(15)]